MPEDNSSVCVIGRPCMLVNVHTDQSVSHICCFDCPRSETAAGKCQFFCHVNGVPREKRCPAMMKERYGDIV